MAKKTDKTENRIVAVEEAFSKTEQFIEQHQKIIVIVVGVLIVLILGYFGFKRFYLTPQEKEAHAQMFMAEMYFEQDSLKKALNGDGNYLGFLDIIDDYGITRSAGLAHYYAGICYLKLGDFEQAIDHLNSYSGRDLMVAPMALGGIGDAYLELNQPEKAAMYYMKAANKTTNDITTPSFLMKAAWVYEEMGDYSKALEAYKRIKADFPRVMEAQQIEKYITNAEAKAGK
ncbi:MAG: tetratricopeptide repeat protein [Bacteroidetes bacterium]|nr:tetratricopeptide repeat protein [Bacteroidota bacterium]